MSMYKAPRLPCVTPHCYYKNLTLPGYINQTEHHWLSVVVILVVSHIVDPWVLSLHWLRCLECSHWGAGQAHRDVMDTKSFTMKSAHGTVLMWPPAYSSTKCFFTIKCTTKPSRTPCAELQKKRMSQGGIQQCLPCEQAICLKAKGEQKSSSLAQFYL
jgi:hypothetical protein